MENAGRAVSLEVLQGLSKVKNPKVSIFCGLGNNGGDGFVTSRHLTGTGVNVKVFLLGHPRVLKSATALNYQILKKINCSPKQMTRVDRAVKEALRKTHIIVDAIFGIGLNRKITGLFKRTIEAINKSGRPVISIDIPSGLDATTGEIYGACIKAAKTVSFSFAKKGFFKKYGPQHTGEIIIADIGIPKDLMRRI